MRSGLIYYKGKRAGRITETDEGDYSFQYDTPYLRSKHPLPISLTLPLQEKPFVSKTMFPFFDGLIPEGWLLDLAVRNWKLDRRDRMGLLLEVCGDCIGAVHVSQEVTDADD